MTNKTISVLGTERIGKMYAEQIDRQVPGLDLVAVYDICAESAEVVTRDLGCQMAASVDEIMARDVDAFAICTSTDTHVDLVVAAAEAAGVSLQVGFNRRFDPAHAAVQQAVADGSVGDAHIVQITSRDSAPSPIKYIRGSVGIFSDTTIHDFDMARFVTGSEMVEVYAPAPVRVDPEIGEACDVDIGMAAALSVKENRTVNVLENS